MLSLRVEYAASNAGLMACTVQFDGIWMCRWQLMLAALYTTGCIVLKAHVGLVGLRSVKQQKVSALRMSSAAA